MPSPHLAKAGYMLRSIAAKPVLIGILATGCLIAGCTTSPLGREQLILFPDDEMQRMGAAAFQEIKDQTPGSNRRSVNGYVECVANSVLQSLDGQGASDWEITVFEDDQANAFALPGRKIGIYTGLLEVAKTQDQLATVVAHEVAHVLAQHGNERISTQYATSAGLDLVGLLAGGNTAAKRTAMGLLGVGAQVGVLLPFSRSQESEADLLGLEMMARAGFEPTQSIELWHNMMAASEGSPPQFLSTHPSGESRIAALEGRMAAARDLAAQAQAAGSPDCAD